MPTLSAQTNAWLRHVYTAVGVAVALLGSLALLSADDQAKILTAVHQIGDGVVQIIAGIGALVPFGAALYARFTAKPAQQIAAVEAQGHAVVPGVQVMNAPPSGSAGPTVLRSLAGLLGPLSLMLMLSAPLGACMWTDSQGNQVVLTVQNATPLVIDKIKQVCAAYDANKVTYDALTNVATAAIQNAQLSNAAMTAQQIATAACPLIEALVKTETAPAALVAPSSPTGG